MTQRLLCICILLISYTAVGIELEDGDGKPKLETVEQTMLLKHRFRIDYLIESITLLVERKFGSPPIIIIQPDGSKWYYNRHPEYVKWSSGDSGDVVMIHDPVAGPWQLVGDITKNSTIRLFSRVGILVKPFPEKIYKGETLKVVANLYGEMLPIRMRGLDYMVNWTIKIISEMNPDDANYKSGSITVGSYKDDGREMDEMPDDGDFTADMNLNHAPGPYLVQVSVKNPVFARQYQQMIQILPKPITVEAKSIGEDNNDQKSWFVKLTIDDDELDLNRTHLSIVVSGPKHSKEQISVMNILADDMLLPVKTVGTPGSYRIRGEVFATLKNGREVMFDLDEALFSIDPPARVITPEELAMQEAERKRQQEKPTDRYLALLHEAREQVKLLVRAWLRPKPEQRDQEEQSKLTVFKLLLINLVVLLALAVIIPTIFIKKARRKKAAPKPKKSTDLDDFDDFSIPN